MGGRGLVLETPVVGARTGVSRTRPRPPDTTFWTGYFCEATLWPVDSRTVGRGGRGLSTPPGTPDPAPACRRTSRQGNQAPRSVATGVSERPWDVPPDPSPTQTDVTVLNPFRIASSPAAPLGSS